MICNAVRVWTHALDTIASISTREQRKYINLYATRYTRRHLRSGASPLKHILILRWCSCTATSRATIGASSSACAPLPAPLTITITATWITTTTRPAHRAPARPAAGPPRAASRRPATLRRSTTCDAVSCIIYRYNTNTNISLSIYTHRGPFPRVRGGAEERPPRLGRLCRHGLHADII